MNNWNIPVIRKPVGIPPTSMQAMNPITWWLKVAAHMETVTMRTETEKESSLLTRSKTTPHRMLPRTNPIEQAGKAKAIIRVLLLKIAPRWTIVEPNRGVLNPVTDQICVTFIAIDSDEQYMMTNIWTRACAVTYIVFEAVNYVHSLTGHPQGCPGAPSSSSSESIWEGKVSNGQW